MGIHFFIGGTGQGKTSMAQHLCEQRAAARGVPVVVLDPEGVLHHKGAEEVRETPPSEANVVVPVWTHGSDLVYTPRGEDSDPECKDAVQLFRMVRRGGNVALLVDECAHYAAADSPSVKAMRHLCRAHRLQGVDLYFTTQAPKDIHPRIWNLRHEVYVFHQEDVGSLDYLQAQLRLPDSWRKRIMSLPKYRFVKWERSNGTSEEEVEA